MYGDSIVFRGFLASLWLLVVAACPALGAIEQLPLSTPLDQLEARLAKPAAAPARSGPRSAQPARQGVAPHALILDLDSLDPKATDALLTAIADLRAAGGSVVAIRPKLAPSPGGGTPSGGVAVLALACDALIFESGATLETAAAGWCTSATRRKEIAEKLANLGRIDPIFASRLIDCSTDLSWSATGGFKASTGGDVELAAANQPIALSAGTLKSVGIETQEFKSVSEAVAAIERGTVSARAVKAPKSPSGATGAPPTQAAKPQAPTLDPEMQAKVDAKLKEYDATLAELKRDLEAFDRFFTGADGTWTTGNRGLKEVWEDKSDNTRHADTKVRCERLQRGLKENVTSLGRILKSVDRMVKDRENPIYARLKSNQDSLDGLRESLERNKVDDYERFSKEVKKLK